MERRQAPKAAARVTVPLGRAVAHLLACVLLGFLGACAFSYVDSDGTRHIIGLVNMRIEPTENSQTFAGEVLDVTSVGLAYHSATGNTSFTIGYSRNVTAALRDNALVLGNPLAVAEIDISE